MIKINLLPSKKKPPKKVTDLQKQVIIFVLVSLLVGAGIFFFWRYQLDMIEGLNREKVAADAKAREQETMLKEVKNVEEERKKVTEKIDIIEKLKKNQAGPVRLLDEISIALPRGVNIASFSESGKNLNLEGDAFTNDEVVRFIDNLKASRFLTGVVLLETSQTKKEGIDMYRYKLQFAYKGL
jgi:type IV pilus assembly protein PilN